MSKKCPRCDEEVTWVAQCDDEDCNAFFCWNCGDGINVFAEFLPGGLRRKCPECGSDGHIVSTEDD